MRKGRRKHSPVFKAKVALEAVKGQEKKSENEDALIARLYQEIGKLNVEREGAPGLPTNRVGSSWSTWAELCF